MREWVAFWSRRPIDERSVFYESFSGEGMLCNPEAIFRGLLGDERFRDLRHWWSLRPGRRYRSTRAQFADDPRVAFLRPHGFAYYRRLCTAKYVVNNATFPARYSKRPGQIYLNTWHGVPLKHMGLDMPGGVFGSRNVIRNFAMADVVLSSGRYMTDTMYLGAYRLANVFTGRILESGFPRIDWQFADAAAADRIRERLRSSGVDLGPGPVVLYAPTWRGADFGEPEDTIAGIEHVVDELSARLEDRGATVLVKLHQVLLRRTPRARLAGLAGRLVPNAVPTNVVLRITDVLVSDYSSILVDHLASGRPAVVYAPDESEYGRTRGVYIAPDEMPARTARTVDELVAAVVSGLDGGETAGIEAMRRRLVPFDDGRATDRVIDAVFAGAGAAPGDAVPRDDRVRVFAYLGGVRRNGITTSALNFTAALDPARFDVTVFYRATRSACRVVDEALGPSVRHLPRVGGMGASLLDQVRLGISYRWSAPGRTLNAAARRRVLEAEARRCAGGFAFDLAIDLSGYGPMYEGIVAAVPARHRLIWMHNDLAAEMANPGRKRIARNLRAVMSGLDRFDAAVSVSPALADRNRAELQQWAPAVRFESLRNLIDADRIAARSAELDDQNTEWAQWADAARGAGDFVFVSVARLSPEKNQDRLLAAFRDVHAARPRTRLVLVGGGPLRGHLEQLAERLGLSGCVCFAGAQANPMPVLARADCFVLSSDYEGQPMVLLEAYTIGLPVVTTAFSTVADSTSEARARVTDRTVASLAAGMTAAVDGEVPAPGFDATAYNRRILDQRDELLAGLSAATR